MAEETTKLGLVRRAASAIRAQKWWVGLAVLVALELAREHLGGQYPMLDELVKALLLALGAE